MFPKIKQFVRSHLSRRERQAKKRQIAMTSVRSDKNALKTKFIQFKDDREIALASIIKWPETLSDVSDRLQNDPEFLLEAIEKNWRVYEVAPIDLKSNFQFSLDAIKRQWMVYESVPHELKLNTEFLTKAALIDLKNIRKIPNEDINKEFLLGLVEKNGLALQYIPGLGDSSEYFFDREITLRAILQNWRALQYAHPSFRDDESMVSPAMIQDRRALCFASARIQEEIRNRENSKRFQEFVDSGGYARWLDRDRSGEVLYRHNYQFYSPRTTVVGEGSNRRFAYTY